MEKSSNHPHHNFVTSHFRKILRVFSQTNFLTLDSATVFNQKNQFWVQNRILKKNYYLKNVI
jgi:hypothetical protein